MPTMKELGLDKLTADERLALADELWESLPPAVTPALTDAKKAELARRIAEDDANPDGGVPADEVFARVDALFGRRP